MRLSSFVLTLSLTAAMACAPKEETVIQPEETAAAEPTAPVTLDTPPGLRAEAVLQPLAGGSVSGKVTFSEVGGGVDINALVSGAPAGALGFHLHDVGDCSAPDFTSAGGHFNPSGHPHAAPTAAAHHAGDFGNVEVGQDGNGTLSLSSTGLTVAAGANSVVGRAVILHERADDLNTQPTGNAGGRIACGVVTLIADAPADPADGAAAASSDTAVVDPTAAPADATTASPPPPGT